MKYLKIVREFFWPLLDPLEIELPFEEIPVSEITVDEANLETAFNLALKYYEDEEDRRKSVESKSSIFIGTVGLLITILLSVTKDFILDMSNNVNLLFILLIINWILIIIYLFRVTWFSIKGIERGSYRVLEYSDFIKTGGFYKKELICKLINKTRRNYKVVNNKVDYMVMAQEYFKRAIVAILVYGLLLVFLLITRC